MAYQAYDLICRRCQQIRVPQEDIIAYLDKFVNELSSEEKVSETIYRARMQKCAVCKHRAEVTCLLCGCFCQARAAMRNNRCPKPGEPEWLEEN